MKQKAIELINQEFEKRKIGVNKIIIFGSRARGDYRKDSDWDFLVVIDKEIEQREKREIASEIRKIFYIQECRLISSLFQKNIIRKEYMI